MAKPNTKKKQTKERKQKKPYRLIEVKENVLTKDVDKIIKRFGKLYIKEDRKIESV